MSSKIKFIFISFITVSSLFGIIFLNIPQKRVNLHPTLTVGLQSGYPPFEFMDEDGKVVGFDVDVAHLLAKKLERELIIKDMEFEGEILSLKQGKIDLIISGMNITPSRLKEIHMVPYHSEGPNSLSLVFWENIPEGVKSIEDIAKLPNPTISLESGAVTETYISRHSNIKVRSFDGALASLMDVKFGKSIANLVDPSVGQYLQKQHPQIKILDIPLSNEEMIMGFGIGVKKENKELYFQVQAIIQELKSSGEIQKLQSKWFKGDQ